MKAVIDALRQPVVHQLKKDVVKEGVKLTGALAQRIQPIEIENKINIGFENDYSDRKTLFYKPSLMQMQQKVITSSNYANNFRLNNSKKAGLTNTVYRQFSTMVDKMEKYADPKNDLVFKKLFGEEKNKDLLIDFINKVLPDKHVKDIEYLPTNLEPDVRIKKQSILDVLCTDENGSKYIIEMQNAKEKGFEKRAVYYASKTYATQMDKGGKYADLKEVIFIAITDFVMFPNKKDYISTHSILDNKTNEHDLKDFSFAFIELPKFDEHNKTEGVDRWCDLFKNATKHKSVDTSDPIIKKAYKTLEMNNWSEQDLLDYQAYEKILLDNQAREDQVRDEGKNEMAIEMAKKMLIKQRPIEEIMEFTGLSKEQINNIKY